MQVHQDLAGQNYDAGASGFGQDKTVMQVRQDLAQQSPKPT